MLDEPMNGLDPSGVFELRKELRKMVDEYGMSLLISSHQLNEIEKIADRIIYIENGKIKEVEKLDNRNQVKIKKISMIFHGFYCTLKIPEEKALFFRVV